MFSILIRDRGENVWAEFVKFKPLYFVQTFIFLPGIDFVSNIGQIHNLSTLPCARKYIPRLYLYFNVVIGQVFFFFSTVSNNLGNIDLQCVF